MDEIIANTVRRAGLGSVVREVATRTVSEALNFSFRMFLEACWDFASETAFLVVTFLAERGGISTRWGQ